MSPNDPSLEMILQDIANLGSLVFLCVSLYVTIKRLIRERKKEKNGVEKP